ncbi:hypothetical protein B1A87_007220 [Arthrobacter sp. KBS0703]|nr:hypothetical protein B1A87_007220 [Arthrobacter sp. KBS0703]
MVKKHVKLGHDVALLSDLRRLDLQQIDAVRGRGAQWGYPIIAAASGAVAGVLITGGELAVPLTGGAAAAPSGGVIAGAFFGDAAVVLSLSSRCVGATSLLYGYDPEDPAEKLFIMSVVNAGTAMSASAKTAAMADISRLTQALVRGRTWAVLDRSLVSQVSKQFAKAFGTRLTKQGLGKVIPAAGTLIGFTLNWATLESIVDVANNEYRKRFLLEKYAHLAAEEASAPFTDGVPDEADEVISVIGEIVEAGGPDLH